MTDWKKLLSLLGDDDQEHRMAAAVVVGALGIKDAAAAAALLKLTERTPDEQRVALDALARTAPKKGVSRALALLAHGAPPVREASFRLLVAAGPDVVDEIRARRAAAGEAEKRELDRVLAELGGSDAFKALLDGLAAADETTARSAALAVREHVLGADKRTRKSFASTTMKVLAKKEARAPQHDAALLKILGWCEDEAALPLLVDVAKDDKRPSVVRQEAVIALRFALHTDAASKAVVDALLVAATGFDPGLARAALGTLALAKIGDANLPKLKVLATHRDHERALLAVDKLQAHGGAGAAATLVDVVLHADRPVAERAAVALAANQHALEPALAAVLTANDIDRARLLAELVVPRAKELKKPQQKKVLDAVVARLADDGRGYEACLSIARAADAEGTAEALRELAAKLKKQKKEERAQHALILLSHTDGATADDRLRLAVAALKKSRLDPSPPARARDEAIKLFHDISGDVDVGRELKRDKSVTDEQLFYLGFHFTEDGDPLGEELLQEVIARSPRSKLGKAAKNKLKLEA